jgi:hypothetical protein
MSPGLDARSGSRSPLAFDSRFTANRLHSTLRPTNAANEGCLTFRVFHFHPKNQALGTQAFYVADSGAPARAKLSRAARLSATTQNINIFGG